MTSSNFWDTSLVALAEKFKEILNEFEALARPLNSDLEKDFIGLAKYLVKTRSSFNTVAPGWLHECSAKNQLVEVETIVDDNWKLDYPNPLQNLILPYLAQNLEECKKHRKRLIDYFDAGHFAPLEPCLRISKALSLPPRDFEDIELANLQEILNHLKIGNESEHTNLESKLLQFETYHGCHCD